MDPATAITIAGLLRDYGPWGICALLILAVVYLHRGWQACQEARVTDGKVATEALLRSASSTAEVATMMAALREGQTEVMRITSLMQRDAENDDERLHEKIAGLIRAVEEMGRRVEATCRGGSR